MKSTLEVIKKIVDVAEFIDDLPKSGQLVNYSAMLLRIAGSIANNLSEEIMAPILEEANEPEDFQDEVQIPDVEPEERNDSGYTMASTAKAVEDRKQAMTLDQERSNVTLEPDWSAEKPVNFDPSSCQVYRSPSGQETCESCDCGSGNTCGLPSQETPNEIKRIEKGSGTLAESGGVLPEFNIADTIEAIKKEIHKDD